MRTVISSWTRADVLPVSLPSIPETYAIEEIEVLFQEIVDTINHIDTLEEEEPSEERIEQA